MEYKFECFGKHEDIARCGLCPDEEICKRKTKQKEARKDEKNKQR